MKYTLKIILMLLLSSAFITTPHKCRSQYSVSLQVFYDQLSPYGQWVDYPQYGYAWIPSMDETFMPYATNGHWILTNYGWTWVSDYNWGWAAFHYGRWYYDPYYGWIWIPDTMWAPAWVAWGQSSGYYGWAPLGPGANVSAGFTNNDIPAQQWVFVRNDDIVRSDVYRYYVNRTENVTLIKNTTIIKNTYVDKSRNVTYIAGPDKNEVQRVTGNPIKPVVIEESNKPEQKVNNDKLVIYKPQVKKEDNSEKKPAPPRVVALQDVKNRTPQQENANEQGSNNSQVNQPQKKNDQGLNRVDSGNNKPGLQENNKVNPQQEMKQQNINPSNNKPVQPQAKKPENVNPQNNDNKNFNQQQEKKAQNINQASRPDQHQVQPKPNTQNTPQQKPKMPPPKPQPHKVDTTRRPQ